MSTLSLDPSVTLFEPAAAPSAAARRGQPSTARTPGRPQSGLSFDATGADTLVRTPDRARDVRAEAGPVDRSPRTG